MATDITAGIAVVGTITAGTGAAAIHIATADERRGSGVGPRSFVPQSLYWRTSPREYRMDQKKPSIHEILSDIRSSATDLPASTTFDHLSDETILRLYESMRRQFEADKAMGGRYRLVGDAAKERLQRLRATLIQRGLKFAEIDWP